jgi:DNA topoisomerase-2
MNVKDFKKHDQISHMKALPDGYIGSITNDKLKRFIITETINENETKTLKAELKEVYYNQGLEQCMLELITNAIDHTERTKDTEDPVNKIEVTLSDTEFIIKNNGKGIPIEIHPEYKIYVPELIFGNMLTSSNYDTTKTKTWMGKYGIGAKCCVVFSKKFTVEICCSGQKYVQSFLNGLTSKTEPVITKCKNKDYTKIYVEPDFKAFSLESFVKDIKGLEMHNKEVIMKRIYDISAITSKKVSVYFNDSKIQIKDFKEYTELFIGPIKKVHYIQENGGGNVNWEVIVAQNPYEESTKISFVNSLFMEDGGTHVDHVVDQVSKKVIEQLKTTNKFKKYDLKPAQIKDNLIFFINCCVENPKFNSLTKTKLTTPVSEFKEKINVPDDTIVKICKLDFVDNLLENAKNKELKDMVSSTKGKKRTRLSDIPKLNDANFAGTNKSSKCILILTEGDSACSMVLGAMSILGDDYYGVMPLKGKLINVRKASPSDLAKNKEIIELNKILGISYGQENKNDLRYHKVIILCDSDYDGSHIKGLLINYFSFFCPKIITDDFITTMLTPVVKVFLESKTKAKTKAKANESGVSGTSGTSGTLEFYDLHAFEKWLKENNKQRFTTKYYKGLATSTPDETKEYFRNLAKNQITYTWDPERDLSSIQLAFDDSRENDRKKWIAESIKRINNEGTLIDYSLKKVPVFKFIDNELVGYSIYACYSKLPNIIDGFKVSQRKVLYAAIKKGLFDKKNQMKVAQLGASCAFDTCYHHGETSLFDTIVNMANNFVGSNNLPLLYPEGQFCTRKASCDNGSPRYIFTFLQPYTTILFNDYDSKLLEYNVEEGSKIEPKLYVPVLPMILINGASSIATGWSTDIPCFSTKDIIENIRILLSAKKPTRSQIKELMPYYNGFRGTIKKVAKNKWVSVGSYTIDSKNKKRIYVRELPIGVWYSKFDELLCEYEKEDKKEAIIDKFTKKSISENGQDYVEYDITFKNEQTEESFVKLLNLEKSISGTNMVGFDITGSIKKYDSAEEILFEHFNCRLEFYERRKKYMLEILENDLLKETEKARFIKLVIDNVIIVFRTPTNKIIENIEKNKFHKIDDSYDFLLNLPIHNFTQEKIDSLNKKIAYIEIEIKELKEKSPTMLWSYDLDSLEKII